MSARNNSSTDADRSTNVSQRNNHSTNPSFNLSNAVPSASATTNSNGPTISSSSLPPTSSSSRSMYNTSHSNTSALSVSSLSSSSSNPSASSCSSTSPHIIAAQSTPLLTPTPASTKSCPHKSSSLSSSSASSAPPLPSPLPTSSHSHMILAGLISGVSVAGLFNPWDRALYLSVLHSRTFLQRDNFVHPYQGFLQVVVHRTLTGGLYFPLFDMAQPMTKQFITRWSAHRTRHTTPAEQSALLHFACGNIAGCASGALLNGLTAIKYASWNTHTGFFATATQMWHAGGYRPFVKGVSVTVARDTVFGGIFALTKFLLAKNLAKYVKVVGPKKGGVSHTTAAAVSSSTSSSSSAAATTAGQAHERMQFSAGTVDFTGALLAGFLATTVSSPLNYVRNIKYGWPSNEKPPNALRILIDLGREAHQSGRMISYWQERLRLGWGTGRVAVGMAVGQYIYEAAKTKLDQRSELNASTHKP